MMRELRGKTALVTGVASGIGRAITLRLAREGVRLFVVDINAHGLDEVVHQARQHGVEVVGRQCDVAETREVSAVVAEILTRWGGVDILVNNAGITYYGRTEQMSCRPSTGTG
jgi:3-oxoacyl-[acyl-carrier protein] reductase